MHHTHRIIRTVADAEDALAQLTVRKYAAELRQIRVLAGRLRQRRAGAPGLAAALTSVRIGFAGNIDVLEAQ